MSQHDYVIDNASGATVRADINSALAAIQSLNSGSSAPSSTAAGMLWLDTTGGVPYALKVRDGGNNHWLTLASVTDPGSDGNIETSATIKGTIDPSASFPSGHIIQIVNKNFSDLHSHSGSSGSFVAVSGFTQTFTLSSSSNKVLVMLSTTISNSSGTEHTAVRVTRDGNSLSSQIGSRSAGLGGQQTVFSNATNSTRNATGHYYDSPGTTSQVTYAVWGFSNSSTFYMNRPATDTDSASSVVGTSNLTLMEIQA